MNPFLSFHTRSLTGIAALWMLSQPGLAQTSSNGIADAVRRGLLAEETTRDFKSASEAYAEAVRMSADQRQIQATALYRLAECQRQLGDANAANTTLQRLAREYPEQRELIAKSGAKVPASGTTGTPGGSRSAAANSLRDQAYNSADLLRQRKSEIEILAKKKEQLGSLDGVQFASRVPAEFASAELYRLISEFNMVASRKDSMNPDFGPEHPEMKRISALQDALKKQIQEQKIAILEQIDETIDRKNREIEALHERIASIERRLEEESKRSDLVDVTLDTTAAAESAGSPKPAESAPTPTPKNSVEEVQASIDRMKVQLGVLQNLNSTWEKGRYLASLSGYYSPDALGGLKTYLSMESDPGATDKVKETGRQSIQVRFVDRFIQDMNDKLRFAQIELDLLKKQAADREPRNSVLFYGAREGRLTFEAREHTSLSDAVIQFGATDNVDLGRVRLHRLGTNGVEDILTVDVQTMLKTGDRKGDIELRNGDRIELKEKGLF